MADQSEEEYDDVQEENENENEEIEEVNDEEEEDFDDDFGQDDEVTSEIDDNLEDDEKEEMDQVADFDDSDVDTQDDDESEDEEEDVIIDARIDDEFKMNYIKQLHPEELNDHFHEANAYTVIERDKNMNIIDSHHKTYPFLTKYEKTRILGLRITQLNEGAKPLTEINHHIIDNHIIAEKELVEKKLPFIIMRPLPNGKKEYWKLQDLEYIER